MKKIRDTNLAIVDQGNLQYEGRPVDLINRVATRMSHIPSIIEVEEKHFSRHVKAREFKVDELLKKDFFLNEIDKIIPPIPQSEIDASKAIVAKLQSEAVALKEFLGDAPEYRVSLLAGTSIPA